MHSSLAEERIDSWLPGNNQLKQHGCFICSFCLLWLYILHLTVKKKKAGCPLMTRHWENSHHVYRECAIKCLSITRVTNICADTTMKIHIKGMAPSSYNANLQYDYFKLHHECKKTVRGCTYSQLSSALQSFTAVSIQCTLLYVSSTQWQIQKEQNDVEFSS